MFKILTPVMTEFGEGLYMGPEGSGSLSIRSRIKINNIEQLSKNLRDLHDKNDGFFLLPYEFDEIIRKDG